MRLPLPISPKYDSPIFEAAALQILLGLLSALIIDEGTVAQICGIALIAFWAGAAVLIWRHRESPTRVDLGLIRFGYLPVIVLAFCLSGLIWHLRGVL